MIKVHKFLLLIALSAIFFIPKISSAQVVINEIYSDPAGSDTGLEWIELYNSGNQAVELGNWQINGAGKYFTIPSFSLEPNSFLLIHWRADGQNTTNQIFTGSGAINENIGNTSGFIALFKSADHNKDTIVDYLEYGKAGQSLEATAASAGIWQRGQFLPAASEGQSLGLKQDGQDKNLAGDWQLFFMPTPGQSNGAIINTTGQEASQQQNDADKQSPPSETASSSPPLFSNYSEDILINEFMPWPETGKEWVELLNSGAQTIDLSAWQVDDSAGQSAPQKIIEGTLIEPNQFLVIELKNDILNNQGDQVRLIWPDGQLLHSISYQNAKRNYSSSRFEDGTWLWTDQPTPGQENKKSAPKYSLPPQTENAAPQNAPPAIATISEAVSQEAKGATESTNNIVAATNENPVVEQPATGTPDAIVLSSAVQQIAAKSSVPSPLLALTTIASLSCLSGIAIVYLKRKKVVDSK